MSKFVKQIMIITILIAVMAFTGFAIINNLSISTTLHTTIDDKVLYETSKYSNHISMVFENAEGAVDALCADVSHSFDVNRQNGNPAYVKEFINDYSPVIKNALTDIEDSLGLFLTVNPEITDKLDAYEIWYSYNKEGDIVYTDATNNGVYQEAFKNPRLPNMRYYFDAVNSQGSGIWTEPNRDPDINEMIITYSRAVYKDDKLIGVIGTDLSTDHTTDLINEMKVENNGMVFLLNQFDDIIISSSNGKSKEIVSSKIFWNDVKQNTQSKDEGIFNVLFNNEEMKVSFSELSNGWKLAIVNYQNELYSSYNDIRNFIIILSIILTILSVVIIFIAVRYISSPVDKAIKLLNMMELDSHIDKDEASDIRTQGDIEDIVRKAVQRQRMSDIMLANHSRLESAGKMMANVIHQWKQPLNTINIVMGNLKYEMSNENIEKNEIRESASKVESLTASMSETLNDFVDYLKPDSESVEFDVGKVIITVTNLVKDRVQSENIMIRINCKEKYISYGYKNSLYHVVLNIIMNAIDAIKEKNTGKGIIDITVNRSSLTPGRILIEIFNDGIPLEEEAKDNLFTPYYSTKTDSNGTGLGLAISRHFIEESMNGEISLENVDGGVLCRIIIIEKEGNDNG